MSRVFRFSGLVPLRWRGHDLRVEARIADDPGRLSGPPEDCYPADREAEIMGAWMIRRTRERALPECMRDALAADDDFLVEVCAAARDASIPQED